MKTLYSILLMSIVLQSCKVHRDFDLTTLTLKKQKINSLVSDIKNKKVYPALDAPFNEYVILKEDRFLNFNNTNLIGCKSSNCNTRNNEVTFTYDKKNRIINQYSISIYSNKEAEKLLSALQNKLGKPKFTSFKNDEDKKNNKPCGLLWEDPEKNHLYILTYSLDETTKARLDVKNNSKDIEKLKILSCSSSDDEIGINNSDLIGKWNWTNTDGGFGFYIHKTPKKTGKTILLNLMKNYNFSIVENGKEISNGTYELTMKKSIYTSKTERFITFKTTKAVHNGIVHITKDKVLQISDNNHDGVESKFTLIE